MQKPFQTAEKWKTSRVAAKASPGAQYIATGGRLSTANAKNETNSQL
jgi:hypothetical protein